MLVAANGWTDHMDGEWWWAMGVGWLIFLGLIVWLSVMVVQHYTTRPTGHGGAHDILAERFARGEITEDEYRARRDLLRD